jgi:hypothetical protein
MPEDAAASERPAKRPEPEPAPVPARVVDKNQRLPAHVPTEAEIDSPDVKTLFLLFVVFAVTVSSWGAARFACNMHPPESRPPPKLGLDRLTANPKDAAIEAIQRWQSYDFDGALAIATGDAAIELGRAKADCAAHANDCARKREATAGLITTAVLLKTDGFAADARVTTALNGEKHVYRVRLGRDGLLWKVTSRTPE